VLAKQQPENLGGSSNLALRDAVKDRTSIKLAADPHILGWWLGAVLT
jgi:hypothetical protein